MIPLSNGYFALYSSQKESLATFLSGLFDIEWSHFADYLSPLSDSLGIFLKIGGMDFMILDGENGKYSGPIVHLLVSSQEELEAMYKRAQFVSYRMGLIMNDSLQLDKGLLILQDPDGRDWSFGIRGGNA